VAAARRLWNAVARPNLMVKIPGTREGLPAIFDCLAEGININITLLFAVDRYVEVADAYFGALERRLLQHRAIDRLASVASFFVSRFDTKVDKRIDALEGSRAECARAERGRAAIANAKIAYEAFERLQSEARWRGLAAAGARPQRLLWGSTSTKDPRYPDLYYVEALIGPNTVDTMPQETLRAFIEHGRPESRLSLGLREAHEHLRNLASVGIDFAEVTAELEAEGVAAFAASFDHAVSRVHDRRRILRPSA
jgi:transaldolase